MTMSVPVTSRLFFTGRIFTVSNLCYSLLREKSTSSQESIKGVVSKIDEGEYSVCSSGPLLHGSTDTTYLNKAEEEPVAENFDEQDRHCRCSTANGSGGGQWTTSFSFTKICLVHFQVFSILFQNNFRYFISHILRFWGILVSCGENIGYTGIPLPPPPSPPAWILNVFAVTFTADHS